MKTLRHLLLALSSTLALLGAPSLQAQAPGSVDSLNPNVAGGFVLATAVQPDGKIIIGGRFSSVQGVARNNIARLNADGSLDTTFDPNVTGQVYGVVVQADGKVLVGGGFTMLQPNGQASATPRRNIARVNADGSLETTFNPNANGTVYGMAVQADGKVLLGGGFTTLQPNGAPSATTRNRIARVNADGSLDMTFDPNVSNEVSSVALQADGKVLLGGVFKTLQPNGASVATTRNNIARVNADGTLDTTFDPNVSGFVLSMAVQADGKVLLGGNFTTLQANGAPSAATRSDIARVNADGSLDTTFDPKANNSVTSVAVQADGKVLLAGAFTTLQPNGAASATTRNRIARLNGDGSLDTTFDPNADNVVQSVAVQVDGKVLLGGAFTALQPNGAASPTTRNSFARLNNNAAIQTLSTPDAATVRWERRGSAPTLTGQVTFEQSTDGGSTYTALGSGTRANASANPEIWQLSGVSLSAGGGILRARGRTAGGYDNSSSGIVQQVEDFGPAGSVGATFAANIVGVGVLATAVQADGKIIIAGFFSSVQGVPRNNIARLNVDGSLDTQFDPNTDSEVNTVAVQADGKVLLGGDFTTLQPNGAASATARNRAARVNVDGSLDATFDPNANSTVNSVAVQADGKVLLAGQFSTLRPNGAASTISRNRVARFNADGSLDTTFDPNADSDVYSVAVQPDGKVLLGGEFNTLQPNGAASATVRNRIARVNADGTLDKTFNPSANLGVHSVVVQPDGKVLLGGLFTTVRPNGAASTTTRNHIARVNADGSLDTPFNPNANDRVYSIALQADGKVLLGGQFTMLQPNGAASATSHNRIARVNADGSLDTTFDPNANDIVFSVALQADGKVLLGGQFTTLQPNGAATATTRSFFARLNNDPATQNITAPDISQVQWSRSGAGPELEQVTFERSSNGSDPWTLLGNANRVGTSSDWQLTGLSLPTTGYLRARGRTAGGYQNGSSSLIEQVAAYTASAVSVLTTQASSAITVGGTISDTATLSGASNAAGNITFNVYGPDDASCGGTVVFTSTKTVTGNGNYTSDSYTPTLAGTYRFVASYSGDAGNTAASGACNDANESVVVSAAPTPTPTATVTPSPTPTPTPSASPTATPGVQLINIATRGRVETGDRVLIGGFIVTGTEAKMVVLRAIGPSMTLAGGTPVSATLQDPTLELHGPDGALITLNDNWRDSQEQQIKDSGLAPKDDRESAIAATLQPGAYTAIVVGKNGTSGLALVEAYDVSTATASQLANISTRGFVQVGDDVIIGGFMLGGSSGNASIALRGIGPSLSAFNVPNPLADPTLDLRDKDGNRIEFNDNYADNPSEAAQLAQHGLAPSDPHEAGMFVSLAPGIYTVIVAGQTGGVGVGLVELYNVK